MSRDMLQFVSQDKEMPQKRDAEARAADFDEIYGDFSMKKAEEAISAIAGLPAGTFLDASEAMKAAFTECAVGGKVRE